MQKRGYHRVLLVSLLGALLLLLAACGGAPAAETDAEPTDAPAAAETDTEPTEVPEPTDAPEPTEVPEPTDAPEPTDEPVAADDEPVAAEDEPVAADDEPVAADDEPVAADDEPVAADDEPVAADDEPTAEPEPIVLGIGEFGAGEQSYVGSGTASLVRQPDGTHTVNLSNFTVSDGPDLFLYLATNPQPQVGNDVDAQGTGYEVAVLQSISGDQTYTLPPDFDVSAYQSVVVYCKAYNIVMSAAPLGDA